MKACFFLLIFTFLLASITYADTSCVKQSGVGDSPIVRPVLANQIGTTHFIIHWESPTTQIYAQNAASYAEYAYEKQCGTNGMLWRVPPPDDNRGGDNRYDIYLVDETYPDIQGSRGITSWEIIGNWNYEWAPSFILIINTLQDNDLKMVVAHEFNHASQLAYTYKDLYINNGQKIDTWFYENTAVWIAEMTYNYAYNYYQRYFGVDPLRYPELGIHSNAPDLGWYNYAGFLWPKFLAEWRNDNDIIRKIWNRMGIIQGENIFNDINIILLSQYSSNLNQAVRYYAEWRYFTGTRDDGMHFLNAIDLPTSTIYNQTQSQRIDGFGGTRFIQFNPTEEIIEINFNGDDAVSWSAHVIEHKYIPPSINKSIALNSVYEGSIEAITEGCQYIVLTPILLSDVIKKYFTHSASMIDARKVFFTNKIGSSNAGGNLKLDNVEIVPSGESKWLRFNTIPHNIKTLNERFINSNIYKHNNWNGDLIKFFLNKNFTVQSANNNHNANFIQLYPATIRNVIDGISFTDQLPVWFNDPWYVKDQYDNQSGMGDFISPPSPYYPTGKYNESSGGIFLNQGGVPPNLNPPFYSVKVSQAIQDIYLPHTGRFHKFYFLGWTGTEVQFQNSNALQTGVVFKDDIQGVDPIVKANFKVTQLSNNSGAFNTNGQRKTVKMSSGYNPLYNVYESLGKVWLESSTDNGQTWRIENNGQPLNGGAGGRCPSLFNDGYTLLITFQELIPNSNNSYVKVLSYEWNTQQYIVAGQFTVPNSSGLYLNPITVDGNAQHSILTIWESNGNIQCRFGFWLYSPPFIIGNWSEQPQYFTLFNTDHYNPSVAVDQSTDRYYLVTSHLTSYDRSNIVYKKLKMTLHPDWTPPDNDPNHYYIETLEESVVSQGCSYPYNYLPSISLTNYDKPIVSWTAGVWTGGPIYYKRAAIRRGPSWGAIQITGTDVNYTNNNSVNGSAEKTVIVWSEGTSNLKSKWMKRTGTSYITPQNLSHSGIQTQVLSGSDYQYMTAMVFNNNTLPYYFIKSTTNFSYTPPPQGGGGLNKITETDTILTYGRSGIVDINGIEFVFNIGDIVVGDSTINFIEIPDTVLYSSTQELNQSTRTEDFHLNPNTLFLFTNFYEVVQKANPDTSLSQTDAVNFKAELINSTTGNVIGTFDNITYNKNNLAKYASIDYEVDCSGITPGDYYLRLVTTVSGEAEYSLANLINDNTTLAKKNYNRVNIEGSEIPITYALEQNYPNPFNPATTIRYQIPKEGMVTLKVYDILGAEVATLVNEQKIAGKYEVNFNASSLASGVYIYRIKSNDFISTKKMVFLK
ncbi:MAG TPA: T9SS type A sorting domain-containing protein [Ignavibacteriaceae bacterium]|nr:T9SS type A sorting domain-containing protein [Ignavibacteriaceae bacterium]